MDVNEKIKYQKSRYIVKKWESDFKKAKGTPPTKADIKFASKRVKEAYSTYWKLKAVLLESSLIDIIIDENAKDCFTLPPTDINIKPKLVSVESPIQECVTSPPLSQPKDEKKSETSISFKSLLNSAEKLIPNEVKEEKKKVREPLSPKKDNINTDSVWGSHLSVKQPSAVRSLKEKSISLQFTEKLFPYAKFSKRNPRKTLRRNKTCDSLPGCSESNSAVLDTSTNEVSLSGETSNLADVSLTARSASPLPSNHLNSQDLGESPSGHFDLLNEVKRVVIKEAPKVQYQGVSVVQALMQANTTSPSNQVTRKLDPGWLGRIDSDSGIASSSGPGDRISHESDDSTDDLIYDSDEESKSRFTLTSNSIARLSSSLSETSQKTSLERLNLLSTAEVKNKFEIKNSTGNLEPCLTNEAVKSDFALVNRSASDTSPDVAQLNRSQNIQSQKPNEPLAKTESVESSTKTTNKRLSSNAIAHPAKRMKLSTSSPAIVANRTVSAKKQAALEKKLSSGAANNNFRRIDISKKVYTRGKKSMNFSKYKKKQWKELKGLDNHGIIKCFKCGDVGHMARQCKGVGDLLPYEEYEEESIFPSLEEAAEAAAKQAEQMSIRKIAALLPISNNTTSSSVITLPNESDSQNQEEAVLLPEDDSLETVKPLYSYQSDGTLLPTPDEVYSTLEELGYKEFLAGQEEAVMTVLSGKSCLVVMPTGSGKSLIYRLPALLYHKQREGAITLVVSPLVSLMEDQVQSSGSTTVGCLHHCQTEKQRKVVEEKLADKQLSVLLVSPELLTSDNAMSLMTKLPPVAFACIDEAHCLSHWSHNFRPSYLSLCQLLRKRLKVKTLLGLTASVTASTAASVVNALGGEDQVSLVKSQRFVPENLILSVSQDGDRDNALLDLLTASRFASCNSIIVYCTRREECVRIAALLRTRLQTDNKPNGKSRLSPTAEVYHAGLTPSRRKQVQNAFMTGKTRIVVATVAFGMGINKRDLRGVIHYNMPSTFENYLQEVGRAGRDGLPAHCHLFLSHSKSKDVCELKRHIYANSVDRCTLRRLLELASPLCKGCKQGKHEVAFPVDPAVEELDLAQEVISTLIAYLATADLGFSLLPHAYTKARVSSYKGPTHLASLAKQCGVLGVGLAMSRKVNKKVSNTAEFNVVQLADSIGWDSGIVKRTLKNLEWNKSEDGKWSRSGLNVEFSVLGFRLVAPCTLTPEQQDTALDLLHNRATSHESTALKQLQFLYDSLETVSYKTVNECMDDIDILKCEKLSEFVKHYFTHPAALDNVIVKSHEIEDESEIRASCRGVVGGEPPEDWTGRAIARILHGISSPRYPALIWSSTPFWRKHLDQDFPSVLKIASLYLRDMRTS